ncbi:response regulator [Gemmobacter nanjingensis]|uniref:Response regulator n=1 Tax=Gemmobacter nanjingensis TaxID=488454 RepID=A0ABQ3F9A0_9RHOB|nr:response regulator [Gemmobacter nanjingensis]GHC14689.1 response regulator [Gemmobacter nanjingensis]
MPDPLHLPDANACRAAPLRGLTILLVEDSRFACDALRLICQRTGARMRRAGTLAAARAHLRLYRPDVVLVDLGLPDGRGEALIQELCLGSFGRARPAILGLSGDPAGRAAALASGADGFVEKPVPGLSAFVAIILRTTGAPAATACESGMTLPADPLALRNDLAHAAEMLDVQPETGSYVAGFVEGIARCADDPVLADVAARARPAGADTAPLVRLLASRLARPVTGLIVPPMSGAGPPPHPGTHSE